jgi:predicted phage replisome organizer
MIMSKENKRYFWIQLKKDFFDSKAMKKLRKVPGGDTYTIIYLKMMLQSLGKDNGKLMFEGYENNFASEIALDIDEDEDAVSVAISILKKFGLIEMVSDTEMFMTEVPTLTGSETDSTIRSRKSRALQCNTNATPTQRIGNTDIDIEKDIDIDTEKQLDTELKTDTKTKTEKKKRTASPTITEEKASEMMEPTRISEPVKEKVLEWLRYKRDEIHDTYKEIGFKSLLTQVEKAEQAHGASAVINQIDTAMSSSWKGMFLETIKEKSAYGNNKNKNSGPSLDVSFEKFEHFRSFGS